jgi:hypothetical protein
MMQQQEDEGLHTVQGFDGFVQNQTWAHSRYAEVCDGHHTPVRAAWLTSDTSPYISQASAEKG